MTKYSDTLIHSDNEVQLTDLVGKVIKTLCGIEVDSEEVVVETTDGDIFAFLHYRDCCEKVNLNDFDTSCDDFSGALILGCTKETNSGDDESEGRPYDCCEHFTWTFYKLETTKGYLWMRWLGESNGYYSESVELYKFKEGML